jgi:hypothetical protein
MKYLLLSILLVAGYSEGCKNRGTVSFDTDFVLAPGDVVQLKDSDLYVGFVGLVNESRCPTGMNCIRAGDVTVELATGKDAARTFELKLDAGQKGPNRRQLGTYTVELHEVTPYPSSDGEVDPTAYRVTLRVTGAAAM